MGKSNLTPTQIRFNEYKPSGHSYEPELTEDLLKKVKELITVAKWSPRRISKETGIAMSKINKIGNDLGYTSSNRRTDQFRLRNKVLRETT